MADNLTILDNSENKKIVDFIKDKIDSNFDAGIKSNLNIVSAYFTIYAFNKLKEELTQKVSHTNFILGEPSSVENLGLKDKRLKVFKIQDENISLEKAINQNAIAKECYNWLKSSNVQIRTAPKKDNNKTLIHGKMYYIEQENNPRGVVDAVVGSSNFTSNGLGINKCSNYELNYVLDSDNGKKDLKKWFDNLWENNTEDAKREILKYIETLYKENSPETVYMKTLYEMFSGDLDQNFTNVETNTKFTDTILWKDKLFQFQKDAVNSIVKKLDKFNGCILADSVGLGKTYTALGVIQYYICTKRPNILVLAPKRLENNWKKYTDKNVDNPFKEDNLKIHFKTHTDLTSENEANKNFDWGDFDLVVIDESHNFRNATGSKTDENGNIIKQSRYDKLMNDIIKNGSRQPKVLLLSATPVNTSLTDLKNQIRLIDLDDDYAFRDSLDIPSVSGLIKVANKKYMEWAKSKYRNKDELLEKLDAKFVNLLSNLTISRSRKQIKNYYQADDLMNKIPKRKAPKSIYKDIDLKGEFPTYEQLNDEIEAYSLSLYKPTNFVIRNKEKYNKKGRSTMTQERREDYLIGMMKMGFLKRLESSIASFTLSMQHILNNIDKRLAQIEMCEKSKDNFILEYKNDEPIYTYEDDENEIDYTVGKKLVFDIRDLDTSAWKEALRKDRDQIEKIYNMALSVTAERDAKLQELKTLIEEKSQQANKKLIVFASYSDTADYLYKELKEYVHNTLGLNIALVTGNGNKTTYGSDKFDTILENFAPEAKLEDFNRPANEQIDILICTDCISEGQNLQDCDTVVNYDIHWNPVRLIQRFGRIDRIGSNNSEIQMISFWPTKDLEHYIKLQYRVEARMALADQTTTTDDYILEEQDLEFAEKNELSFREKQIKKLMAEEPLEDIEDSSEDFTLSDISMEDFYTDLTTFKKSQNDKLEQLPLGLNAVIPNKFTDKAENVHTMPAGIIFCLKQKHSSEDNKRVNKFQPYYLVYIKNDGTMYLSFEKGKRILDIYRTLCLGKNVPYQELCDIFNKKLDMENGFEVYNQLLKTSVDEITKSYQKDIVQNVFSRGAFIPTMEEQVKCEEDFELISWLIIGEDENVG